MIDMKKGERKLTGAKRRAFQTQVTLDHLDGNVRQAESVFGWSRKTVELGLNELRTGITCIGSLRKLVNLPSAAEWKS
jgi:hypothetical protein